MDFKEYQELAGTTDISKQHGLPYYALGMNGEAGEVAEKIKKLMRGDKELDTEYRRLIMLEMGDVLWYIAGMCRFLEVDLETVAAMNINKLFKRKETGTIKGDGDEREKQFALWRVKNDKE